MLCLFVESCTNIWPSSFKSVSIWRSSHSSPIGCFPYMITSRAILIRKSFGSPVRRWPVMFIPQRTCLQSTCRCIIGHWPRISEETGSSIAHGTPGDIRTAWKRTDGTGPRTSARFRSVPRLTSRSWIASWSLQVQGRSRSRTIRPYRCSDQQCWHLAAKLDRRNGLQSRREIDAREFLGHHHPE